jgi:hypothetical protein
MTCSFVVGSRVTSSTSRNYPPHRKIGHSSSIKWYQITGRSVSFIEFYPFSLRDVHRPNVHRKNYKKNQVRTLSPHCLALHFSFSNLVLLNLCAFASLVAGRLVFPRFTTFLLSFMHPTFFISFHPFYVEILGRLIWLSKKRKERNNKEKSKGTVQNHKQKKEKKESERRNQKLASKLSNSAPLIFGKQDHPTLCAIFSSRDLVPPSPPLHAYLPRPLAFFCSVSLGSRSILYVFAPLFNFTFAD